jgi:hypothetical protein
MSVPVLIVLELVLVLDFLLVLGLLPLRSIDRHSPNCSAFSRQRSKTEDEDDYENDCEEGGCPLEGTTVGTP